MNPWHEIPFVRLLIPFLIGIILSDSGIYMPETILCTLFGCLCIAILILVSRGTKNLNYRYRLLPGVISILFMFMLGFFNMQFQNPDSFPGYFGHNIHQSNIYTFRICSQPEIKANSVKAIVNVEAIEKDGILYKTKGKLLVYFSKDSYSTKLSFNDILLCKSNICEVSKTKNPHEFDYKHYLKHQNILYQSFVKTGNWKKIGKSNNDLLLLFASTIQKRVLEVFKNYNISGSEYAVISGLLLGQRETIDPDLMQAYSASGTIHILSVSGLHVGILFIILQFLFKPLQKSRKGRIIRTICMIAVIWFYALITGLSPSVCRASAMFTLLSFGDQLKREKNPYNTLAAAAFILLLAEPNMLMNIGFQLSFIAVIGIVVIYPELVKLFLPKKWLWRSIWQLTAVSLAAQIATAPLSLYYFHQFPNYFLLANMALVPLSNLIVYSCCIFLAFSWIPYVSDLLSWITTLMVKIMNYSVCFIEQLPASTTQNIVLSQLELWIYYLIILSLIIILIYQRKQFIWMFLSLIIILNINLFLKNLQTGSKYRIYVYHIQKSCAIDFYKDNTCWFIADSVLINNPQKIGFHIKNNRIYNKVKQIIPIEYNQNFKDSAIYKRGPFIVFGQRKFLLFGQKSKKQISSDTLQIDRTIISHNYKPFEKGFSDRFLSRKIIIDGSVSDKTIQLWTEHYPNSYLSRDKGAYSEEW